MNDYLQVLATLTADGLDRLDPVTTGDIRFADPFHDTTGRDRYKAVLAAMYRRLPTVTFTVTSAARTGDTGLIAWTFAAADRRGRPLCFAGMSRLEIAADGRISSHVDVWDPTVIYDRVPVLAPALRLIRRRIAG